MRSQGGCALGLVVHLFACVGRGPIAEPAPPRAASSEPAATRGSASAAGSSNSPIEVEVRTRWPAAERVVAVGDLHGDFAATERVLALAGLAKNGHWTGGKATLVQVGDVLDRGDGERAILERLERLGQEARAEGGEVIAMNGNHELMNAAGDFRYVTPGGFEAFQGTDEGRLPPAAARLHTTQRARAAAFAPGGSYARRLAKHPTVAVVGDTVFVHGGLPPEWAGDLEGLNRDVSRWLAGVDPKGARVVAADDGPVWSRRYAEAPDEAACAEVEQSLAKVGARRMVVGHTVQRSGVTSACDEKVWRIDVGLAAYYGGKSEALEIRPDGVRVIRP